MCIDFFFFFWDNIKFLSPVKMWILCYRLYLFKEKQANVGGGGYVWYVFIHLWETEMHDFTPPSPIPPVWLVWLTPNTLHPFMCINVNSVHKTQHLLTFFVIFTFLLFKQFLFNFLESNLSETCSFPVGCIYLLIYLFLKPFCKGECNVITVGQ